MKYIASLILIYFVFRFLSRLFIIYLIKKSTSKGKKYYNNENIKKEGEVSIDKMPKNKKKSNNNLGDYVDYEELD
tara:strand:- start:429 stop:653 length:225 start_codon:yes stop_codon:yes gene_type:complete